MSVYLFKFDPNYSIKLNRDFLKKVVPAESAGGVIDTSKTAKLTFQQDACLKLAMPDPICIHALPYMKGSIDESDFFVFEMTENDGSIEYQQVIDSQDRTDTSNLQCFDRSTLVSVLCQQGLVQQQSSDYVVATPAIEVVDDIKQREMELHRKLSIFNLGADDNEDDFFAVEVVSVNEADLVKATGDDGGNVIALNLGAKLKIVTNEASDEGGRDRYYVRKYQLANAVISKATRAQMHTYAALHSVPEVFDVLIRWYEMGMDELRMRDLRKIDPAVAAALLMILGIKNYYWMNEGFVHSLNLDSRVELIAGKPRPAAYREIMRYLMTAVFVAGVGIEAFALEQTILESKMGPIQAVASQTFFGSVMSMEAIEVLCRLHESKQWGEILLPLKAMIALSNNLAMPLVVQKLWIPFTLALNGQKLKTAFDLLAEHSSWAEEHHEQLTNLLLLVVLTSSTMLFPRAYDLARIDGLMRKMEKMSEDLPSLDFSKLRSVCTTFVHELFSTNHHIRALLNGEPFLSLGAFFFKRGYVVAASVAFVFLNVVMGYEAGKNLDGAFKEEGGVTHKEAVEISFYFLRAFLATTAGVAATLQAKAFYAAAIEEVDRLQAGWSYKESSKKVTFDVVKETITGSKEPVVKQVAVVGASIGIEQLSALALDNNLGQLLLEKLEISDSIVIASIVATILWSLLLMSLLNTAIKESESVAMVADFCWDKYESFLDGVNERINSLYKNVPDSQKWLLSNSYAAKFQRGVDDGQDSEADSNPEYSIQ